MTIAALRGLVAIEQYGSITNAAKTLGIGQPNLSKLLQEAERETGFTIFVRTRQGAMVTQEGAELLRLVKETLRHYEKLEDYYQHDQCDVARLNISVPRASYVANAFVNTVKALSDTSAMELNFVETNSLTAINNITDRNFSLGIIRVPDVYKEYYLALLKIKGLAYQPILHFTYWVVMSQFHPLANQARLTGEMLRDSIEIIHGDVTLPGESRVDYGALHTGSKRIYVYERGSQFNLLDSCPLTYMQVSPIPQKTLDELHLVQLPLQNPSGSLQDLLVYPRQHVFTSMEKLFCSCLKEISEPLQKIYRDVLSAPPETL